jgi:hypothetical protein
VTNLENSIAVVANQATSTKNDVIHLAGIVDLDHSNITELRSDLIALGHRVDTINGTSLAIDVSDLRVQTGDIISWLKANVHYCFLHAHKHMILIALYLRMTTQTTILANSIEVVANQATNTKNDVINLAGIVDLDHSNITQLRGDLTTVRTVCIAQSLSHWYLFDDALI